MLNGSAVVAVALGAVCIRLALSLGLISASVLAVEGHSMLMGCTLELGGIA